MSEPRWIDGALLTAFEEQWAQVAAGTERTNPQNAVLLISQAMEGLLQAAKDLLPEPDDRLNQYRHDELKQAINTVRTSVTLTLGSVSAEIVNTPNRDKVKQIAKWSNGRRKPVVMIDSELIAKAIRDGLSEVERVLGAAEPVEPRPVAESRRLLDLVQELLSAKARDNPELAWSAIERLREYLGTEGIEVLDYDPADTVSSDEYFDFEVETDRPSGGYMIAPALLRASPRGLIRRGRVGTDFRTSAQEQER